MHSQLAEIKEHCLCTFRFSEILVIILLPVFWALWMEGIQNCNQKSLNTSPLYKCSNMLIRYKIIYRNFAWFYMGRKFILFIYDAHIVQDDGNHIKPYKGKKLGQDPPTWLFELKTQNMLGPWQSHYLFLNTKVILTICVNR